MKTSLVVRITFLVATIIVAAFAIFALIVHRTTSVQFVDVQREEIPRPVDGDQSVALAGALENAFATDPVGGIKTIARNTGANGETSGTPFIVVDAALRVIATNEPVFADARVSRLDDGGLQVAVHQVVNGNTRDIELSATPRPLYDPNNARFGELIMLPRPVDEQEGQAFALRVWQDAAPWLVAVLIASMVVTAWLLRYSLVPVDRLTKAASSLKNGEFPEVQMSGGGSAEFEQLVSTFNAATRALADTDRLRRQLISDIAHELRTPVTNIKGQLEALQAGLIPANKAFADTLQSEARLLERLVEDFQAIALSDAGQLRLTIQPLPLRETVGNIVEPMALTAGASLSNDIPVDLAVMADEERIRQVLINLFDNARHARPNGLIVTTTAVRHDDAVILSFSDNGPGIAAPDQPHIFERFYRAEQSRNRATGGAGLGLTIVHGLVEAMSGTIEYADASSGGATFRVTLPSCTL